MIEPKRSLVALLASALLAGCGSSPKPGPSPQVQTAPRPAPIMHLVYVKLVDPGEAAALVADADRMLGTIPSVTSYFCGLHKETGRPTIEADYDVAMGIGFADLEGYQRYIDDPAHRRFVEAWKPRCAWLRIHDVEDLTP